MALGWLLIPALGGYWFLMHCYWTRYSMERASGYHVFFQTVIAGGFLVVGAYVLLRLLTPACPQIGVWWKGLVPFAYSGTAAVSVILGLALPPIFNCFYGSRKAAKHAATENGDFIELLIAESIERQMEVELSLRSGKSYIGLALNSGLETSGESDIALIPLVSGYRENDTHRLRLTTYYGPVLDQLIDEELEALEAESSSLSLEEVREILEDFRIIIPLSEIVSARFFDPDVYEIFQQAGDLGPDSTN